MHIRRTSSGKPLGQAHNTECTWLNLEGGTVQSKVLTR